MVESRHLDDAVLSLLFTILQKNLKTKVIQIHKFCLDTLGMIHRESWLLHLLRKLNIKFILITTIKKFKI